VIGQTSIGFATWENFMRVLNVAETIGKQKYTAIRNKIGEEYKADKINPYEYLKFLSIVEDVEEE